jgi:hypothetical protein
MNLQAPQPQHHRTGKLISELNQGVTKGEAHVHGEFTYACDISTDIRYII